ncbi:MAG TPA: glyoxalase [Acidimicrobiia bacterium]|nr:glyoxalase [Acidimicrobiia bacterium]
MKFLTELDVAGDRDAWQAAGFAVAAEDRVALSQVSLCLGTTEQGIGPWRLREDPPAPRLDDHPNGAVALDHLVVFTDDPARTTTSFADHGWSARRVREVGNGRTQTFFRSGEVIIELVGPIAGIAGEQNWGLAITVRDLDACAVLLGDRLGAIKDAVQPGRRIATLHHEACGLTVPIAFMSA